VIRLRMGTEQAAAVDMYCTDIAHDGEFPGTVEGNVLVVAPAQARAVWEWLIDASNGLDDEASEADRDADDRRIARQWRDALHALTVRLGKHVPSLRSA